MGEGNKERLSLFQLNKNEKIMKRIILTYGLIAGGIVGGMLLITMPMYEKGILKFENGQLLGYSTMVISLSLIFFGVKSYRDREGKGVITFGTALKVGLLISLVAALMYALCWEISYNTMSGDFLKQMTEQQIAKMKNDGATEIAMQEAAKQQEEFATIYKNPIFRFGITLMEIFPVGILISLLSAALLKKKEFLPSVVSN